MAFLERIQDLKIDLKSEKLARERIEAAWKANRRTGWRLMINLHIEINKLRRELETFKREANNSADGELGQDSRDDERGDAS